MADLDLTHDITPVNANKPPTRPGIASHKTAIQGSAVAASYPASVLQAATLNDLRYIARLHGITVTGP